MQWDYLWDYPKFETHVWNGWGYPWNKGSGDVAQGIYIIFLVEPWEHEVNIDGYIIYDAALKEISREHEWHLFAVRMQVWIQKIYVAWSNIM